jgi:hypothetical protein
MKNKGYGYLSNSGLQNWNFLRALEYRARFERRIEPGAINSGLINQYCF